MGWIRTEENIIFRSDLLEVIEFDKQQKHLLNLSPHESLGRPKSQKIAVIGIFRREDTLQRYVLGSNYATLEEAEECIDVMLARVNKEPYRVWSLK